MYSSFVKTKVNRIFIKWYFAHTADSEYLKPTGINQLQFGTEIITINDLICINQLNYGNWTINA